MLRTRRIDNLNRGYQGDMSIFAVLAAVISVLGLVWLVLRLGTDPLERSRLPEDAKLAGLMLVPGSGPWLGITLEGPEEAPPPGGQLPSGVEVTAVMVNSPAESAGLQPGDVITRVDSSPVQLPSHVQQAIAGRQTGDSVRLVIQRDGRQRVLRARLSPAPATKLAAARVAATGDKAWLGVDVQPVDKLLADRLGLSDQRGVAVSYVYPNSPASVAGLAQGDVIRRAGETPLRDVDQLAGLIANRRPGDVIRVGVWHRGAAHIVSIALSSKPPPEKQPHPTLAEAEVEIEAAWLGLDIIPLTKIEAQELGLPPNLRGMLVDGVAAGQGVDAGFQPGDVIVAINGISTASINDFKEATEGAVGALVDVIRYGRHIYVSVPPPGDLQAGGNPMPPVRQVNWYQPW